MDTTRSLNSTGLKSDESLPPPVSLERLRNHFRQVYKLNEEQVEFMVKSASQSLQTALAAAEQALESDDPYIALAPVAHSFKGLLLNIGEGEWAALARAMEQAAKAGQPYEYAGTVRNIREGLMAVADYNRH